MMNNKFLNPLLIVVIVFMVSLIILVNVQIFNGVKEGSYIGKGYEFQNIISFSGEGEVYVKPDMGLVTLSVVNEDKDVSSATEENTKRVNNIILFLKNNNVEEKDIKTTDFSISPRYDYLDSGKRVLAGYQINQSIEVKIRDIGNVGTILEGAVTAGANQVGSINFVVDDSEEYEKEARALAIADAKQKAYELSEQLGVTLVEIVNFNEGGNYPIYDYDEYSEKRVVGMGMLESSVPDIQVGENTIRSSVSISYSIK